MEILGLLIIVMVTSHKRASPHEQVSFIRLKQEVYVKCVQSKEFDTLCANHTEKK